MPRMTDIEILRQTGMIATLESRFPFSRPNRKHARHATTTDPPRETRSGRFPDARTARKNGSPADFAQRTETPEGRTVSHSRPYATERMGNLAPPDEAATTATDRQARSGRKDKEPGQPPETKTTENPPGIRKPGYSELRRRGAMEYPDLYLSSVPHSFGLGIDASDRLRLNRAARP